MEVLTPVATVVGFVAALAAGIVVWRGTTSTATAEIWRKEAEAQKARSERLESELDDLKLRVDQLERENATLRELVTSREAVRELDIWAHHAHDEAMVLLTRIDKRVSVTQGMER